MLALASFILNSIAEEVAPQAGHVAHHPSFADLVPFWINFIIYAALLYFLLRKKVAQFLRTRSSEIEEQVNRGAREIEASQATLLVAEERLSGAAAEVAAIEARVQLDARNEATQIFTEAEEKAARIRSQAKELVQAEKSSTENGIKRELSELVLKKTTERIARELTSENDRGRRAAALSSINALFDTGSR